MEKFSAYSMVCESYGKIFGKEQSRSLRKIVLVYVSLILLTYIALDMGSGIWWMSEGRELKTFLIQFASEEFDLPWIQVLFVMISGWFFVPLSIIIWRNILLKQEHAHQYLSLFFSSYVPKILLMELLQLLIFGLALGPLAGAGVLLLYQPGILSVLLTPLLCVVSFYFFYLGGRIILYGPLLAMDVQKPLKTSFSLMKGFVRKGYFLVLLSVAPIVLMESMKVFLIGLAENQLFQELNFFMFCVILLVLVLTHFLSAFLLLIPQTSVGIMARKVLEHRSF